jgi:(p)ppGpp synthase/HD superfamily hydrolase
MYSYRIEQAIRAASILHHDQLRKGPLPYPYITHLLSVAFMLMEYTDDENIIIAGLLHDTLEDTDYTEQELRSDFGHTVADLVVALTEPRTTLTEPMTWLERKQEYIEQLRTGGDPVILIATVDKLHNLRSIVETYYTDHTAFVKDFGKQFDDRQTVYRQIADIIQQHLKHEQLRNEFAHVYATYTEFITDVQQSYQRNHV